MFKSDTPASPLATSPSDQQVDALTAAGVDTGRIHSDKLSGTSTGEQRPGLASLLDYARESDAIVLVGIDRVGRNARLILDARFMRGVARGRAEVSGRDGGRA